MDGGGRDRHPDTNKCYQTPTGKTRAERAERQRQTERGGERNGVTSSESYGIHNSYGGSMRGVGRERGGERASEYGT
mgnify:CR=1 FL=1